MWRSTKIHGTTVTPLWRSMEAERCSEPRRRSGSARRAAERASGGAIEGNGGSQDPSSWRQISPPSWPLERLRRASVLQYEGRIRAFPANGRSLHPKGQSYSILSANSHQSALHRSPPTDQGCNEMATSCRSVSHFSLTSETPKGAVYSAPPADRIPVKIYTVPYRYSFYQLRRGHEVVRTAFGWADASCCGEL